MKSVYQFIIFSGISLFLISCYGSSNSPANEELQEYVERFKEEAAARGQNYNARINEIDITIVEITTNGVLGQCVDVVEGVDAIQIDWSYWNSENTSDLDKEFVVFHELGHCVLQRGHLNTPDDEGVCLSMMYDGNSLDCMLDYFSGNREAMINELFE